MAGKPPRYGDAARRLLFAETLDHGKTVKDAVGMVRARLGVDMNVRSARALVSRERLRRERAASERVSAADLPGAVDDLARRLYVMAAEAVKREERRSSPDLVRLKRAASVVRELRQMVAPRPPGRSFAFGSEQGPKAPNGHGDESESTRLASALADHAER